MKKICFSCPTVLLKRPIAEIISKLDDFQITLLIPRDIIKGNTNIHFKKIKNISKITYHTFNLPFSSSEWPIPINPLKIFKILKVLLNNDIIHVWVPFYINNTLIILLKKLFFPHKKFYLTMDTFPALSFKSNRFLDFLFKIYYKTIGKVAFSAVNKVIIYGKFMKKFAIQAGIPLDKLEIIPTGVNIEQNIKFDNIKKEFNIKNDEKVILFIGILNFRKGIDTIIKIAEILKNQDYKFLLVGDGPMRNELEKYISKNVLNDKIIFAGFRNDIHNFYYYSNVFLLPSRGEGLPGVIMESMAYGLPVIASNIEGIRELIKDNYNGFLCEVEDIECYIKKINILLTNDYLQEKFIINSQKIIEDKFNWKKNIERFKNLY